MDIEKLSEEELIHLNHRIIERLRLMRQIRTHKRMLQYKIGERVSFHPEGHERLYGTLVRFNRKSLTIITEDGGHWNVAPSLIRRADKKTEPKQNEQAGKVVELFPQNSA